MAICTLEHQTIGLPPKCKVMRVCSFAGSLLNYGLSKFTFVFLKWRVGTLINGRYCTWVRRQWLHHLMFTVLTFFLPCNDDLVPVSLCAVAVCDVLWPVNHFNCCNFFEFIHQLRMTYGPIIMIRFHSMLIN